MKIFKVDIQLIIVPICVFVISTLAAVFCVTYYSEFIFEKDRLVNSKILSRKIQYYFSENPALSVIKTQASINKNFIDTIKYERIDHPQTVKDLEKIKKIISASIIYIMNNKGNVIASTKYDGNKSITGNNYSFREYFLEAMKGNDTGIPALGVTTKKRGIYYSSPIYAGKKRGVIVVKLSADELDRNTSTSDETSFRLILTPDKYVFSGGKKHWIFNSSQNKYDSPKPPIINSLPFDIGKKWIDFNNEKYLNLNYHLHFKGSKIPWSFSCIYLWPKAYRIIPKLITVILMIIINILFWGWIASARKKKAAIQARIESNKIFETIVQEAPFGIVIIAKDKKIIDANPEAIRLMGRNKLEEIQHKICHQFICPTEIDNCPVWDKGQAVNKSERKLLHPQRGEVDILKTCLPIIYKGKKCLLETFIDISEQKLAYREKEEAYKKVLHNSKLAALGSFTTGITHEINNPLTIATGYLKILKKSLQEEFQENSRRFIKQIETIEESTDRISKIVDDLQIITNDSFNDSDSISTHDVLDKTLKLLATSQEQYNYRIKVIKEADKDYINGNFSSLSQIYLQILNNAVEAMYGQKNGEIKIFTYNKDDQIVLEFLNNGPSIPEEYRRRIFEIFFTTHEHGTHAGTGLSICHSLITSMDGEIEYINLIPQGSKFIVKFPNLNRRNFINQEGTTS